MSASTSGVDAAHRNQGSDDEDLSCGSIPAPPKPSADTGVKDFIPDPSADSGALPSTVEALDIGTLSPRAALSLFSGTVKSMISSDDSPQPMLHAGSPTSLGHAPFEGVSKTRAVSQDGSFELPVRTAHYDEEVPSHHKTPIGSPEASPQDASSAPQPPCLSLDGLSEYDLQCLAMASTFRSKTPPPISLTDYLQRIHKYCPMSTAVYLAAASYIQRVTGGLWESEDPRITYVQITPHSVHRLVLAALRVAMKAFEDHNWKHSRFAGVGGVPNTGLTKLEVAMCYLLEFNLFIPESSLQNAAKWMLNNGLKMNKDLTVLDG